MTFQTKLIRTCYDINHSQRISGIMISLTNATNQGASPVQIPAPAHVQGLTIPPHLSYLITQDYYPYAASNDRSGKSPRTAGQ